MKRYRHLSWRGVLLALVLLVGASGLVSPASASADTLTTITNAFSGLFADPAGRGTGNGTHIHTWTRTGENFQQWVAVPVPGDAPYNMYKNVAANRCLSVSGRNIGDGVPIILWDCNNTPDQHWLLRLRGDGKLEMANENSRKCLSVNLGKYNQINQDLIQYTCHNGNDQAWQ